MSAIDDFLEDLAALIRVPDAPPNQDKIADDEDYKRLSELVNAVQHSPSMDALSSDELRNLNTFIITVVRCGTMMPGAGRAHIAAAWRPAEAGVIKLPLGLDIRRAVHSLVGSGT